MKRFRSILFWTHLTAGLLGGIVIFVMSFTGVVLALKPQIQNWIEREVRVVAPQTTPRLSAQQLLAAVKQARPDSSPQTLAVDRDPATAAIVNLGREGNVFVNPYTGAILGTGSQPTTEFFQAMTSWHRYMGATGEYRPTGRSATGASNFAFLMLAVTGLYIWWPKQLTFQYVKPIVWFRRTSTGRARDFNWHNTIGFWCLIPIVIMTVSGVVMSYSWANDLVYRVTGSPIPAGRGGGPGGPGAGNEGAGRGGRGGAPVARGERPARGSQPGAQMSEGGARPGGERPAAPREEAPRVPLGNQPGPGIVPAELDQIWARAERQVPSWSLLSMRLPNREGAPVAFTITDGANWNAFARSNLTLNSASGEVVQWQPYEASNLGQKLRGWLRFAHTGELGGLPGQVIAGLGCLGGVFLVYTGFSLAFRRLWNWSLWKRLPSTRRAPLDVGSSPADAVAREAVAD